MLLPCLPAQVAHPQHTALRLQLGHRLGTLLRVGGKVLAGLQGGRCAGEKAG